MEPKPITLIIRQEDAIHLKVVMQDSKIEKGVSETLRICVEDAYRLKPDFREDLKKAKKLANSDIVIEEKDLKPKSFLVENEIFQGVYNDVKEQMGLLRPRISYVVRLCICSARIRFEAEKNKDIQLEEFIEDDPEGRSIPNKGDAMMMLGSLYDDKSKGAKDKLIRIFEIMEGGKA